MGEQSRSERRFPKIPEAPGATTSDRNIENFLRRLKKETCGCLTRPRIYQLGNDAMLTRASIDACIGNAIANEPAESKRRRASTRRGRWMSSWILGFLPACILIGEAGFSKRLPPGSPLGNAMPWLGPAVFFVSGVFFDSGCAGLVYLSYLVVAFPDVTAAIGGPQIVATFLVGAFLRKVLSKRWDILTSAVADGGDIPREGLIGEVETAWRRRSLSRIVGLLEYRANILADESHNGEIAPQSE